MFAPVFRLIGDLEKIAERQRKGIRTALQAALFKSAFLLSKDAKADLKAGNLRLQKLSYLSNRSDPRISQPRGKKALLKARAARNPLTRFAPGIRYKVNKANLTAEVGFLGGGRWAWTRRLAEKSAQGYTWGYTAKHRASLHRMGIHLRKTTFSARVPPRGIMDNVHQYLGPRAQRNIETYFARKMKGERI